MIKNKQTRKTIAIFFLLNFLSTLFPYNVLYANNNGPDAPEAAAFEPVDATDMVNLATGDLSYVLPLLNIPSPEGGYPLALNYHAGIAMDQEASWVGLGWNLNPGALNRGVNGYPDDWGATSVNEFFYDKGWIKNYYEFSIGATFPTGITVGVGVSWGSNRAFGGSVTFGVGGMRTEMGVDAHGNAIGSASVGFGNSAIRFSESGVGLGLGLLGGLGRLNLGIGNNGVSVNSFNALGVNLSSNGASYSTVPDDKNRSYGGGIQSSHSSQVLANDYDLQISHSGLNLDLGAFWIKFGHTRVKYSLFKIKDFKTSGVGYLYDGYNDYQDFNDVIVSKDVTTDVHKMSSDGVYGGNFSNLYFPSYDVYSANAQGFSSRISPRIYREVSLFSKNNSMNEDENNKVGYILKKDNLNRSDLKLDNGIYFYDIGSTSSFLRDDRSEIKIPSYQGYIDENKAAQAYTDSTGNYSTDVLSSGEHLKRGYRKREGTFIKTYTNEQIVNNNGLYNFLDAMSKEERQSIIDKGAQEAIGGFQITTIDGKTYHYSLPVYNYEKLYKNFKDKSNEFKNFYEKVTQKPYATHWLLTGITGPDYVDVNNDGKLDEGDYGYWVEFNYGKWSEAYGYRTPQEGFNSIYLGVNNEERHSYSVGRKEIYYLDAIKTRTHTALFIKSAREDNQSSNIIQNNSKYNGGSIDSSIYKSFPNEKTKTIAKGDLYKQDGTQYRPSSSNYVVLSGKETKYNYIDYPISNSLKLERIILLKNNNVSSIENIKTKGNDVSYQRAKAFFYTTKAYTSVNEFDYSTYGNKYLGTLYRGKPKTELEGAMSEFSDKVIDQEDIVNLGLEEKAVKVIDFNYDYSLATQSLNSKATTKGKLTLNSVSFKGKNNIGLIPPYIFDYNKKYVTNDKDKMDVWGYHLDHPDAWSLNKIVTPIGTEINVEYEADVFEPINNLPLRFSKDVHFATGEEYNSGRLLTRPDSSGYLYIDPREHIGIEVGDTYTLTYFFHTKGDGMVNFWGTTEKKSVSCRIIQKTGKTEFKAQLIGSEPTSSRDLHVIEMLYNINKTQKGGGLRTKSIFVGVSGDDKKIKTEYDYLGGVTSYIPYAQEYDVYLRDKVIPPSVMYGKVTQKSYDTNNNLSGYTSYGFEVMKPMTIDYEDITPIVHSNRPNVRYREYSHLKLNEGEGTYKTEKPSTKHTIYISSQKLTVKDMQSSLGRILYVNARNKNGDIINTKTYKYKSGLSMDSDGEIGVEQESFITKKKNYTKNPTISSVTENYAFSSLSMVNYPNVLSSISTMYNGVTNNMFYTKKDFLTGKRLEIKADGSFVSDIYEDVKRKTKTVPAYTKYSKMGSKVDDITNKNMLTQEAASYSYILKGTDWKPVGVGITTWNNVWGYTLNNNSTDSTNEVWRKHKTYTWKGAKNEDGTLGFTEAAGSVDFNWGIGSAQTTNWQERSNVTKYNQFSQPLEVKDINGNYAATKMGDNYSKVIATANAGYDEMHYSGAEYLSSENASYFDGGISSEGYTTEKAHTGKYSVKVTSDSNAFNTTLAAGKHRSGRYKISVWANKKVNNYYNNARVQVGSSTPVAFNGEKVFAGDWVQLNHYVTLDKDTTYEISITSDAYNIYLDDFRLHPASSSMMSYVYNEWDEVSYITGANGLSTHYIYDAAGRLEETWVEVIDKVEGDKSGGFKRVSENKYNYKRNNQ